MVFHRLVRWTLVIALLLGSTPYTFLTAFADDEEGWEQSEDVVEEAVEESFEEWSAGEAPGEWSPALGYLAHLLDEINLRRERAGTGHLTYLMDRANDALGQYLADLTPEMEATGSCFHGGASGWDYVADAGFSGDAVGEVIACPGDDGFWTPDRIAEAWWSSPMHQSILYGDPGARAVACGTYGPQAEGAAFRTVVCVAYRY